MIAPARPQQAPAIQPEDQDRFIGMLPQIRNQAGRAFGCLTPELKDELVQEVIANAFCAFVNLVRRGKSDVAFATPLANFAIRQALAGRQVGTRRNQYDLMSPFARVAHGIVVERLDRFDHDEGGWQEVLVEDRRATPADIAAARIDVAAWLRSLPARDRRIAKTLATGETPSETARKFRVSRARISQLREVFRRSWDQFQGEGVGVNVVAA